jgi:hypothetical protein
VEQILENRRPTPSISNASAQNTILTDNKPFTRPIQDKRPSRLSMLLEEQQVRNLEEKVEQLERDNDLMQRENSINNSWIDKQ